MNQLNKFVSVSLVFAAFLASASAMAVTRACSGSLEYKVTSDADGKTRSTSKDLSQITGTAGTVFLARREAGRHARSYFANEWTGRTAPEVQELIKKIPNGKHSFESTIIVHITGQPAGCDVFFRVPDGEDDYWDQKTGRFTK